MPPPRGFGWEKALSCIPNLGFSFVSRKGFEFPSMLTPIHFNICSHSSDALAPSLINQRKRHPVMES